LAETTDQFGNVVTIGDVVRGPDGSSLRVTATPKAIEYAQSDAVGTGDVSVQDAESVPGRKAQFGKLSPSEAASLRWEKERARARDADAQAVHEAQGVALIVRTTVQVGTIISALEKAAKKGDVAAARELRAYLAEAQVETETDLSSLDRRTLQALKARLLAEIEDEGIEQPDVPTDDDEATA